MNKHQEIIKVSWITIIVNVVLSVVKLLLALYTNSLALQADAINGFTDGVLNLVTIIGITFSVKQADEKHPFGYGRFEYLTDAIVSLLILFAGYEVMLESIHAFKHPVSTYYEAFTLWILFGSVLVKMWLGNHEKKAALATNSTSLKAASVESYVGGVITFVIIISALIENQTNIILEPYLTLLISLELFYLGFQLVKQTISDLLGQRVDKALIHQVKETVCGIDGVLGVYDMTLHSYGLERYVGSIHIEVDEDMSMKELDTLERTIAKKVYEENDVMLLGISIYCLDTHNQQHMQMFETIKQEVLQHHDALQVHGFYVNDMLKKISFDVVMAFSCHDQKALHQALLEKIQKIYPDYQIEIQMDLDVDIS